MQRNFYSIGSSAYSSGSFVFLISPGKGLDLVCLIYEMNLIEAFFPLYLSQKLSRERLCILQAACSKHQIMSADCVNFPRFASQRCNRNHLFVMVDLSLVWELSGYMCFLWFLPGWDFASIGWLVSSHWLVMADSVTCYLFLPLYALLLLIGILNSSCSIMEFKLGFCSSKLQYNVTLRRWH